MIQIYYGDGKGKTTAAIGQGVRAAGAGLTVFMVQFLKTFDSGELHALERLSTPDPEAGGSFQVFRFERPHGFIKNAAQAEAVKQDMEKAMEFVAQAIRTRACDVLILDEVMDAAGMGLVDEQRLEQFLEQAPASMEIVMTGHQLLPELAEKADYITQMRKQKHPYDTGVEARKGIEF